MSSNFMPAESMRFRTLGLKCDTGIQKLFPLAKTSAVAVLPNHIAITTSAIYKGSKAELDAKAYFLKELFCVSKLG